MAPAGSSYAGAPECENGDSTWAARKPPFGGPMEVLESSEPIAPEVTMGIKITRGSPL